MITTIGELLDPIMYWSNRIEMSIVYSKPFMKVYIPGLYGTYKLYLYILQYEENKYKLIESDDDINERYIYTGNSEDPFITEKQMAVSLFDQKRNEPNKYDDIINIESFKEYLIDTLFKYDIIKFQPSSFNKSIVNDMGFNSCKIRRILTSRLKEYHAKNDSVKEFIKIIMDKKQHFDLYPMKPKEVNCIFAMLRNLGLEANIEKNIIISLNYIRRQ